MSCQNFDNTLAFWVLVFILFHSCSIDSNVREIKDNLAKQSAPQAEVTKNDMATNSR